jgi:hypothetical protein
MNSSIPKALIKSREFWALGEFGRLLLRGLWRKGEVQRWESREALLRELQSRGVFLGSPGPAAFEAFVAECLTARVLLREEEALVLPILSGDRPKGEVSAAALRKRDQRKKDAENPARVEERRQEREARKQGGATPVTSDVTRSDVTPDVTPNVTPPVTPNPPASGRDTDPSARAPAHAPSPLRPPSGGTEAGGSGDRDGDRDKSPVTIPGRVPQRSLRTTAQLATLNVREVGTVTYGVWGNAAPGVFRPGTSGEARKALGTLVAGHYSERDLYVIAWHWQAQLVATRERLTAQGVRLPLTPETLTAELVAAELVAAESWWASLSPDVRQTYERPSQPALIQAQHYRPPVSVAPEPNANADTKSA